MAKRKSTGKTTVAKVEQPHGGALNAGGTPGNRGGPGRPPRSLRTLCHRRFRKNLRQFDKMLQKRTLKDSDRITAMGLLARYGSDTAMPVPELRKRLQQQNGIIRNLLPEADAERVIQGIRSAWAAG